MVGKVIHWELCKKLKFDSANKWYMHNVESVQENETLRILWDFEIQKYHQISTWRSDLVTVNLPSKKKTKTKKNNKKREPAE